MVGLWEWWGRGLREGNDERRCRGGGGGGGGVEVGGGGGEGHRFSSHARRSFVG